MKIKAISYYLPETVLTNSELAAIYPEFSEKKISSKVGIDCRHIAKNETVSDMAVKSAEKLFDEYGIDKNAIDFIILCTQSPDYKLPTTACIVQDRLGLRKGIGAYDINLGCSGFIYSLATAKGLIAAGIAKNVLVITSETYSKYINDYDKSTRTIFGDAAASVLVSADADESIGEFVLGTDGSGRDNLIVPAGGSAMPQSAETSIEYEDGDSRRSKNNIFMDGGRIFEFTMDVVPQTVRSVLEKNGLTLDDIKMVVPHQANKFMLTYLRNDMDIPKEKFYVNMKSVGNTVSVSIPMALKMAMDEGKLEKGDKVLIIGFGVGYSWGAVIITI